MVDFSSLLRKPAGEAKKPPTLPAGDYPGVIKGKELGDNNRNRTPYLRLLVGLIGWPADAPTSWEEISESGERYTVSQADVDLAKRQLRRDYYLTDDALFRLDDLIRSCGIDPQGRAYEEILEELIGQQVTVEVQQYLNQTTNQIGNQVGKLAGAAV